MKLLNLTTDVLAIKCVKNYIFIGIGCTLYVVNKADSKTKLKLDVLHPDNIHDIIYYELNNKLIIYGRKSCSIFNLDISEDFFNLQQIGEIHRFDDWIIDIKWLEPSTSTISILFAHNNVHKYELNKRQYSNCACKETCLLYAGQISGKDLKNAVVFSGTVFQEVLIWKVKLNAKNTYSDVLHRLKGHKGVIFSVFYNPLNNIICSTSDDRTVRLWKVSNDFISTKEDFDWDDAKISLQTTMYGHLARVWKAILLNNIIASIGEDSRICFWNLSGELLHKIEAHQGSPIWCIDMSEDNIIYTGGADGSVHSWPLRNIKTRVQNYTLLEDNKDVIPKHVIITDNSDILIYTNLKSASKILHFDKDNYHRVNSYNLPEYSSTYCIMELSPNRQYIALASIKGDITLYKNKENSWEEIGTYKILDSKIFSIQWLDFDKILISSADGNLNIVKFFKNDFEMLSKHLLPSSRERWVTSACTYQNLLICGDRMGSIFIYKIQSTLLDPIQAFKKIHGRLGVQSCIIMDSSLVTTGRDGTLRFYKICDNGQNSIEFLYAKNMPMDWVSKILKNQNDYYVLGFKEDDFVVYSTSLRRILSKIPCGGGHRSWDCIIYNKMINFVYIQKRQAQLVKVPLDTLFIPPIMTGFHTKEIYCIKLLPILSKQHNILISGGEDCILHISYIDSTKSEIESNFKILNLFDGHLSSIKCISIFTLKSNENSSTHLIFSGGGRAQLKVWKITVDISSNSFTNDCISCKDMLSYMLHGPDKERSKIWVGKELMYNADPETRYMDLSTIRNPRNAEIIFVFIACSDGYLRTLSYNIISNEIKLIDTLAYKNRCILKVHSFMYDDDLVLISMATDGHLNFWNVFIENDTIFIENVKVDGKDSIPLHQSGINCFDIKLLNDKYVLATGGDDNLLSLLVFKVLKEDNKLFIEIVSSWSTSSLHYAQITGVKLLNDNKMFSVGADQKLAIHNYTFINSKIESILLQESTLCISDIQGITFCKNQKDNEQLFCTYGKGFQILQN